MSKLFVGLISALLLPAAIALAADKTKKPGNIKEADPKTLSGISIVGNSETPKSLTIVPWRSAGVSKETKLTSSLLNERLSPVDKDEFMRELEFYKLSNPE